MEIWKSCQIYIGIPTCILPNNHGSISENSVFISILVVTSQVSSTRLVSTQPLGGSSQLVSG